MELTLSNPDAWKPLSGSERSKEITDLIRGRFDEKINPEDFEIRIRPGYTEVSSTDKERGYCFADNTPDFITTLRSRNAVMKISYRKQDVLIKEEFFSYDKGIAGFAWRKNG